MVDCHGSEAKPAQSADIVTKRVEGGVQKYLKEVSLADQVFVKAADGKQTVAQMLKASNTNVKGFTLYALRTVMSGRGDELLDLADTNVWRRIFG